MLSETDAEALEQYLARKANGGEKSLLSPGDRIEAWRVMGLLGRGGSAEVYRVVHSETGQAAAVKVLVRAEQGAASRFRDEVAFLAANQLPQFRFNGRNCQNLVLIVNGSMHKLSASLFRL